MLYYRLLVILTLVSVRIFTMAEPLITWSPTNFFTWFLSHSMHSMGSNHRQQLFNIFLVEKEKHISMVMWLSNNYPGPWQEFETWTFVLEMWWMLGLNDYRVGKACFPGTIYLNCELGQMDNTKWSKASFSILHPGCLALGLQYIKDSFSVSSTGHRLSYRLQTVLVCASCVDIL